METNQHGSEGTRSGQGLYVAVALCRQPHKVVSMIFFPRAIAHVVLFAYNVTLTKKIMLTPLAAYLFTKVSPIGENSLQGSIENPPPSP